MTAPPQARSVAARLKRLGLVRIPSTKSSEFASASRTAALAAAWQVDHFGGERAWRTKLLTAAKEGLARASTADARLIQEFVLEVSKCCEAKREALIPQSFLAQLTAISAGEARDETVEYFDNFVRRWGVPEGIGPLDEVAARGGAAVRITRRNTRVRRLESLDGAGNLVPRLTMTAYLGPAEASEPECRWDFSYDECGNLTREEVSNPAGWLLYVCSYAAAPRSAPIDDVAGLKQLVFVGQRETTAHYSRNKASVTHARTRSGASFVRISRNEQGFDERLEYFDGDRRQPNELWSFGEQLEAGVLGLATQITSLGANLKPAPCQKGFAAARHTYDSAGNLTSQGYFDEAGTPVLHSEGYHKAVFTWNEHRNWSGTRFFDIAGEPAMAAGGFAGWNATYNEAGNRVSVSYLDTQDRATVTKEGYASWKAVYDPRGRMIEQTFFDAKGRPVRNRDRVMRWTATYDDWGNLSELVYRDAKNRPIASGIAGLRQRCDGRGSVIEERYFDTAGNPVRNKEGSAGFSASYDEEGNQIQLVYLGLSGEPDWCNSGFARLQTKYDYRGRILEETFFGPAGEPAENRGGCHRKVHAYDEHGNRIQTSFFRANGNPAYLDGYAVWTAIYDKASGNLVRQEFRDAAGRLTWHGDGYAVEVCQYDVRGNQTGAAFLGPDRRPVTAARDYAGWLAKYDGRGRMIEQRYLDAQGNLVESTAGFAAWQAEYDDRGNVLARRYFASDGKLKSSGRAAVGYVYDSCSNRIAETWYDASEKPLVESGVAGVRRDYDDRGNPISQTFLGSKGEIVANENEAYSQWKASYDSRDNRTKQEFFGTEGQPVVNREGFLRILTEYDDRNRPTLERKITPDQEEYLTRTAYEHAGGRTEVFTSPYRQIISGYGRDGKEIHESWFRPDGSPETTRENELAFSRWEASYNELGRLAGKKYFDAQGTLVRGSNFEYDARGDASLKVVDNLRNDHRERVTTEIVAEGRRVQTTRLVKNASALLADRSGRAEWHERFDQRGNRLEVVYYDAAGKPASYCGHYHSHAAYDATSRLTLVEYAIPQGESSTLVQRFRFTPDHTPPIVFDSYETVGATRRNEAFVLRYTMTTGDALRYSASTGSVGGEGQGLDLRMVQRCTAVNPDQTFEIAVDIILGENTDWHSPPQKSVTMTMTPSGKVVHSSIDSPVSQPSFPTHPVFVGEEWQAEVPTNLVNPFTNQPWLVPLTYTYALVGVERGEDGRIAHIRATLPLSEAGLGSEALVRIRAEGNSFFAIDRGVLLKSEVTTAVAYKIGGEQSEQQMCVSVTLEDSAGADTLAVRQE